MDQKALNYKKEKLLCNNRVSKFNKEFCEMKGIFGDLTDLRAISIIKIFMELEVEMEF